MSDFLEHRKENGRDVALKVLDILTVDDDELNQRLLGMILSGDEYKLTVSYDGYDALKCLEKDAYDLVFMDITIPRVNGFEVCEHIRGGDFPNKRTPIIALTALPSMNQRLQDFLDRGMFNECVHKPFDRKKILEIVSTVSEKTYFDFVPSEQSFPQDDALTLNSKKVLPIFDNDFHIYQKLFEEFLASLPKRTEEIQRTREVDDWKKLSVLAHNLTGVTRNFGAEKLSGLAEKLDSEALNENTESIDRLIEGIKKQLPELQKAYSSLS